MKKKLFLSALLISLFSLAAAKPVQADTSVADIQKRGKLVAVSYTHLDVYKRQG